MGTEPPIIIGIAGGSCAGKTWLAGQLAHRFGQDAIRISLDDFYRDRTYLAPRQRPLVNFDHPRAIDWPKFEEVLSSFSKGMSASVPRYNFQTHGRMAAEQSLNPTQVILVEGLWLFRRSSVRKLFTLKVFLRSSREWCEQKRLQRDTLERGRTVEQVKAQLDRFTFPMFEKFVSPQERWADLVLGAPVSDQQVEDLARRIKDKFQTVGI